MKTTKTGKLVHFAKNVITEINEDILNPISHSCLLAKYYEDENSYHITIAPGLNFNEYCSSFESRKFKMKTDFILGNLFVYKNINKDDILDLLNHKIEERAYYLKDSSDETN
jgi:hypothetical protein